MLPSNDVPPFVRQLIERIRHNGRGMLGSQVGSWLRALEPGFDPRRYGTDSLRSLLAKVAPELKIVGYSGPDPVYGLAEWPASATQFAAFTFDAWRTWVSPGSPVVIGVRRTTGAIRAVPAGTPVAADEVRLDPASLDEHRRIAREFLAVAEMEESIRRALEALVAASSADWWKGWLPVLRSGPKSLLQAWHNHRHASFERLLKDKLAAFGLSPRAIETASGEIVGAHRRASTTRTEQVLAPPALTSNPSAAGETELRRIVQFAVSTMSFEELRALRLPVGAVVDAVTKTGAA
jgi:hypothetical protein